MNNFDKSFLSNSTKNNKEKQQTNTDELPKKATEVVSAHFFII